MARQLSEGERRSLSTAIVDMLEDWAVAPNNQLVLMGFPEGSRARELRRLRHGAPFPDNADMLYRVAQLLAIQDCLRTAYPRNGRMAGYWLNRPSRHFNRRAPLAVMLEGVEGLGRVRTHLDCTQNWI